jgi:hypothetical protein
VLASILLLGVAFSLSACGHEPLVSTELHWGETATWNGFSVTMEEPALRPGFTYEGKERWETGYTFLGGSNGAMLSKDDAALIDTAGKTYFPVGGHPRADPAIPDATTPPQGGSGKSGGVEISPIEPIWYLPTGVLPAAIVYTPSWTQSWKVTWR